MTDSFQRYLRAKRTVDDRALDRRVVGRLREAVRDRAAATTEPFRVVDAGAGIGTMLTRAVEWDLLPDGNIEYVAVDIDGENIDAIRSHVEQWANGRETIRLGSDPFSIETAQQSITVRTVVDDVVTHAGKMDPTADLLVGVALLDLVEFEELGTLLGCLASGGLCYFPITFDGATRFRPRHPADDLIESRYHDHMDQKPGGNSQAGGDVLTAVQRMERATLLDAGGSDWIVRPIDGEYPSDEAYFLRHIVDSVESAVGELAGEDLPELNDWLDQRRAQIDDGELLYLTHQLDVLGRVNEQFETSG